jgi:hypothetical protein
MRGSRWLPHEDAVLAKVGAAAREAAPDRVRDRSVSDPVFLRYVADHFHADPNVRERTDEAILTRLKKEHKAIAYNRSSSSSSRSSRSSRSSNNDDCCSTHDDGEDDDDDEPGAQKDEDDVPREDAHPTSVSFEDEDFAALERSSSSATTRISARSTASSSASSDDGSDDESDDHADGGDDGWFSVPCDANRARLLRKTKPNSHIKFDDDSEEPIPPTAKAEAEDDFTKAIETLGDTLPAAAWLPGCLPPSKHLIACLHPPPATLPADTCWPACISFCAQGLGRHSRAKT